MTNCNPFKDCDSGVLKEYLEMGKGNFEEPVTFKIYTSTVAGDPALGIAKTFEYNLVQATAIIAMIQQEDIVYSGGVYQIGDINVQSVRELKPIDDITGCPGDRLIWRGHEYRQVGNIATNYLAGYVLFDYVFRRI